MMRGIWSRFVHVITRTRLRAGAGPPATAPKNAPTSPSSTDNASHVLSDNEVELLRKSGLEVEPMAYPMWRLRLRHWIFGCIKMPHYMFIESRSVQVGRICPVCWMEFPL